MRPHLEYAACLWKPSLKRDFELIERVQHRATKCITGLQSKSYTDRLKILGLDSLQTRRFIFDMVEVFRILQSDTSDRRLFELSKSSHNTRGHNFKLKKIHCKSECRKNFFSNRVIGLWNSLPYDIVNSSTLSSFKLIVTKFLQGKNLSYF